MSVKYLDNDLIKIDKTEALRYLRYKNEDVDENTGRLLDESAAELKKICRLKYVFRIFNLEKEDNNISFENHIKIKSDDLKGLFKHCDKSAVMAATLDLKPRKESDITVWLIYQKPLYLMPWQQPALSLCVMPVKLK